MTPSTAHHEDEDHESYPVRKAFVYFVTFYEAAGEVKPVRVLHHSVRSSHPRMGEIRSSFYSRSS
jgi:hypothetical protein